MKSVHIQKCWIQCANCSAKFLREDTLIRHNKEVHSAANVNQYYSVNSNNKTIHDVLAYECEQCDKRFKRKEHVKSWEQFVFLK